MSQRTRGEGSNIPSPCSVSGPLQTILPGVNCAVPVHQRRASNGRKGEVGGTLKRVAGGRLSPDSLTFESARRPQYSHIEPTTASAVVPFCCVNTVPLLQWSSYKYDQVRVAYKFGQYFCRVPLWSSQGHCCDRTGYYCSSSWLLLFISCYFYYRSWDHLPT